MIEISPMLKKLAAVAAFIARVLVGRKKRHREELQQRARAWQELADAIKRKEPPPVIQSLFAILIGHDKFSVPLVKWILRQPDPLKAARWLLRVWGYVAPVKGGRLIELKSVAANPPLRRRLIAAGIATYFPLAFISLWMDLYMANRHNARRLQLVEGDGTHDALHVALSAKFNDFLFGKEFLQMKSHLF
jgi:hypothetical protein